jgi:hypothetical protein
MMGPRRCRLSGDPPDDTCHPRTRFVIGAHPWRTCLPRRNLWIYLIFLVVSHHAVAAVFLSSVALALAMKVFAVRIDVW